MYALDFANETKAECYAFETFASGTVHHADDDACDPTTVTKVVKITDRMFRWGMAENLANSDAPTGPRRIEDYVAAYLADLHAQPSCGCEYDCCGHRSGHADAYHIAGALYCVQIHTSRNY